MLWFPAAPPAPLLVLELVLELVLVVLEEVLVELELELDVVEPPVPAGVLSLLLLHAVNASPVTATTAQNDVFMIDLHPRVT